MPYLLDACQSVGQMPVDVEAIGCDMLSATGRKFLRAPRGTGFLYVRRTLLDAARPGVPRPRRRHWAAPDRYELRADARRFENWETSVAGRDRPAGGRGLRPGWGLDAIAERVTGLAAGLRARLAEMPGVTVRDLGERRCGIVTFTHADGADADVVAATLRRRGSTCRCRARTSTLPRHRARATCPTLVRASVHYVRRPTTSSTASVTRGRGAVRGCAT